MSALHESASVVAKSFKYATSHHFFGLKLGGKHVIGSSLHGLLRYSNYDGYTLNQQLLKGFKNFNDFKWTISKRYIRGGKAEKPFYDFVWAEVGPDFEGTNNFLITKTKPLKQPEATEFVFGSRFTHDGVRAVREEVAMKPSVLSICPASKAKAPQLLEAFDVGFSGFSGAIAIDPYSHFAQGIYVGRATVPPVVPIKMDRAEQKPCVKLPPGLNSYDEPTKAIITMTNSMLNEGFRELNDRIDRNDEITFKTYDAVNLTMTSFKRRGIVLPCEQLQKLVDNQEDAESLFDVVRQ